MKHPFIRTNDTLTVVFDNQRTRQITSSSRFFPRAVELLNAGDFVGLENTMDRAAAVVAWSQGNFTVYNGELRYKDEIIHDTIAQRILRGIDEGAEVTPFLLFIERLRQNPSYRSRQQLYDFLEANDLPITADGYFLAYKVINRNWTDCYTGRFDNSIGAKPEMPRHLVNDDPTVTCSQGLHVCSEEYAPHYGGWDASRRLVVCKVNPRDVVAVPTDYNRAKMRLCKYEVVGEVSRAEVEGRILNQSAVAEGYYDTKQCEEAIEVFGIIAVRNVTESHDDYDDEDDYDDDYVDDRGYPGF